MIESIEKLRDESYIPGYRGEKTLEMLADEIEAEIAERYMLLPCDADGVPIHVGDAVAERPYRPNLGEKHGEVACLLFNSDGWSVSDRDPFGQWWHPATLMHVNPRTIEDVLRDLVDGIGSVEFDALTAIGEAADEIRELMEVDE